MIIKTQEGVGRALILAQIGSGVLQRGLELYLDPMHSRARHHQRQVHPPHVQTHSAKQR